MIRFMIGRRRTLRWGVLGLFAAVLAVAVAGCSMPYYSQAAWGHTKLLLARRDVGKLVEGSETSEERRDQLRLLLEVRDFASASLALPDNRSYRSFVELGRPYAVWNVIAAPELSTLPLTWCFPVAGCVSYRGYFSEKRAQRFAEGLHAKGSDVYVYGVAAYSTIGWFSDPALSSFVDWPGPDLAGLIFHELAHQVVYVADDTTFNESFASFVAAEGVSRWLDSLGRPEELSSFRQARTDSRLFADLVAAYRGRLQEVFDADRPDSWKKTRKKELLGELKEAYRSREGSWASSRRYDRWFQRDLNNAHLASVGSYEDLVPAFGRLFEESGSDFVAFYQAVRGLAELDSSERSLRLEDLDRIASQVAESGP